MISTYTLKIREDATMGSIDTSLAKICSYYGGLNGPNHLSTCITSSSMTLKLELPIITLSISTNLAGTDSSNLAIGERAIINV